MTWRQYYEKFYDWADSTQRSRLSSVTDFSGAKAEEVIEIALAFVDEVPATRLMKKAIDSGVRFSAEDVMEVIDWVRADFRLPLAESAASAFTEEDIDYLDTLLPKKSVDALARRSGVAHEAEEPVRREQAAFRERKRRPGAFGAFFAALGAGGGKERHGGRCCGDCSKCPPHYGYRYGRWYYGRNHVYGCEFGGNGHPGKT